MKKSFLLLFVFIAIHALGQDAGINYLPASTTHQIVKHTYYTLSYSERDEQAEWVAYELTGSMLMGTLKRTDNFRVDPYVTTGSATPEDYKDSGYDRGHLTPAADMAFSSVAMQECFYMSNVSPMAPSFNRGIWEKLEDQVRTWARENEKIYVVTGGILKYSMGKIGSERVTVPGYFYKIVLDYTVPEIKAIAFILPNEKGVHQLYDYAVTIDSIENLTGIDFFPRLPDSLENAIESKVDIGKWSFVPINFSNDNNKTPAVQCKGMTKAGVRCKNKTTSANGYCYLHQNQDPNLKQITTPKARRTVSVHCSATTKAGTRCKRMTYSPNGKCWQHGGD